MIERVYETLDPRGIDFTPPERRIYGCGDFRDHIFALVSEEDYQWAIQWMWCPNWKRVNKAGLMKCYLKRAVSIIENKVKIKTISLYLHVEIMKRTGIPPPTENHTLADHRDGDSLNCQRWNLRWATHSMNSKNVRGKYQHDLVEG